MIKIKKNTAFPLVKILSLIFLVLVLTAIILVSQPIAPVIQSIEKPITLPVMPDKAVQEPQKHE